MKIYNRIIYLFPLSLLLSGCTTINVDHIQLEDEINIRSGDAIVILGRHHSAEIETEASIVSCLGNKLSQNVSNLRVIPEREFTDQFYPWFEARTAPQHPNKLAKVFQQPNIARKAEELGLRFFVWVTGSTERTSSKGSMSCTLSPAGGGCFGFGVWEDTSDYETTIWDVDGFKELGRISTEAVGTSYMPAFVVPVPLLAQVEDDACRGMGNQLVNFFINDGNTLKKRE